MFSLLYPLLVVIPLCWNLYYERKNNFLLYVMPRVNIQKYLTAKWIAYALGTLCIIVVPYVLSAVSALYIKPPVVPFTLNKFYHIFQTVFIENPLLYAVAISCWRGLVSILVMTFGFVLALYCKNIFVILTGPFMYSILENFVLSILRLESYRLVVSFVGLQENIELGGQNMSSYIEVKNVSKSFGGRAIFEPGLMRQRGKRCTQPSGGIYRRLSFSSRKTNRTSFLAVKASSRLC